MKCGQGRMTMEGISRGGQCRACSRRAEVRGQLRELLRRISYQSRADLSASAFPLHSSIAALPFLSSVTALCRDYQLQ
jgi:hypothetical protein